MVEVRRTELLGTCRTVSFLLLCFPLPCGKEHWALALTLILSQYRVPLTYSSHVSELLYDPRRLEDKDMAHPGIGRAERPRASPPASVSQSEKGPADCKDQLPRSWALVPSAELGVSSVSCTSFSNPLLARCQNIKPFEPKLVKVSIRMFWKMLWGTSEMWRGWWKHSVIKWAWEMLLNIYMHINHIKVSGKSHSKELLNFYLFLWFWTSFLSSNPY